MSRRLLLLGLPVLSGLVALGGCAAPDEAGQEQVGSSDEAIQGGATDPGDPDVVDVVWQTSQSIAECSGSLLAPNMVLTAHHCVSTVLDQVMGGIDCAQSKFSAPDVPANFFVSTKELISMNAADYHTVSEIVVPPGSTNTGFCGFDQAILILSDQIPATEAVPLVPRVDTDLAAKEKYTAIGFGGTTQDGTGAGTRRRLDGLVVQCVGSGCSALYGGALDPQHEWVGDHGTCEGDSGGPALDDENRVVGVTSRGANNCASPIYGDVYSWADWIKQTAQHAADVGHYAAPSWVGGYPTDPAYSDPIGGACDDTTTCPSNICLADAAGYYCSRLCETAAPCPDGYTCATIQDLQICQRSTSPGTSGSSSVKSGCSVQAAGYDGGAPQTPGPTRPAPWLLAAGLAAVALRRRRTR